MDLLFFVIWTSCFPPRIFSYSRHVWSLLCSRPKCIHIVLAGWPCMPLYQLSVVDFFCYWMSPWTSCVFVLHLLSLILVYILFCVFCVAQSVPRTNRGHLRTMMVILRSWLGIPGCGGGEEGWIRVKVDAFSWHLRTLIELATLAFDALQPERSFRLVFCDCWNPSNTAPTYI